MTELCKQVVRIRISYEYGVDFVNFYSVFGTFFIYGQTNKNCPVLAHFLLRILKILRMRSRGKREESIINILQQHLLKISLV